MEFEIADIMLLVKSIKYPSDHFPILNFVKFCSHPTRAGHSFKLKHSLCRSNFEQSYYFNRIPRLWNSLPFLDINLPLSSIKSELRQFFWDHFLSNFNSKSVCTYHFLCPCPKCIKLPIKMRFFVIFCCYVYCYICLAAGIKPSVHQHSFIISVAIIFLSFYHWLYLCCKAE